MIASDFYLLRVKQKIWVDEDERVIISLQEGTTRNYVTFKEYSILNWDDICEQCSLEAPKPKAPYYIHTYWGSESGGIRLYTKIKTQETWEGYKGARDFQKITTIIDKAFVERI